MKILIALASSSSQLSGVQRHAVNLARCLLTRPEITEVNLVAAPWQQDFIHDAAPHCDGRLHIQAAPIGKSALSRNQWFYTQLPKLAKRLQADIVHLAYPAPVRRNAFHCPAVVTLHDLYPYDIPENFGFPKVFFNRAVLRGCLQRVDAIACVSENTLSGLTTMYPTLAHEKAVVVYNSVEPLSSSLSEIPSPLWAGPPFLLCVAQHRRNKNVLLALQIFERMLRSQQLTPHTRLIILGIPGPETAAIENYIASEGLQKSVLLLNGISDEQLHWCYHNCILLLAPSSLEGFGLPVAEALLAGCRVVCSDIPAFREIGGQHCHYVGLGSNAVERFSEAIQLAVLQEPQKPVTLPNLSAPVIAETYLKLYRSLIQGPRANALSRRTPSLSPRETGDLS
jgi:glycosyltransferase involved in cell wall biosynthesis